MPFDESPPVFPETPEVRKLLERELAVDLGGGDVTTGAFAKWGAERRRARVVAKAAGVLAGVEVFALLLDNRADPNELSVQLHSGKLVQTGVEILNIIAPTATLLAIERTGLNTLCHLSGIATLTRAFVDAVAGTPARITDTRKTLPGLRTLQKYAVRCGGGLNHRSSLAEMVLLKNNHLAAAGSITAAVEAVRRVDRPSRLIEVEVDSFAQFTEAAALGVDLVMLDNMPLDLMRRCVAARPEGLCLEASGNVTLQRVRAIAETGVDYISVGALTHSAPALDCAFRLSPGLSVE